MKNMKYYLVIMALYVLSGLIFTVDIESADITDTEDNAGMIYGYTPGAYTSTDSITDLVVDGVGFFILRSSGTDETFFTRIGKYDFDDSGYLVASNDYIVQGWKLNDDAETIGAVSDIQTPSVDKSSISIDENGIISEIESDNLTPLFQIALAGFWDPHSLEEVEENLFKQTSDSGAPIINYPGKSGLGMIENYSLEEIDVDFSYEADIWVDGDGYFVLRDSDDEDQIYYAPSEAFRLNLNGQMVSSGDLIAQGWEIATNDESGETERIGAVSGIEFSSLTIPESSDYSAQALVRVLIDEEGIITAYYSEGLVLPCFQIALASFEDESALDEIDTGLFEETSGSGPPTTSAPGENWFGSLVFVDPEDNSRENGGCFINLIFK